MIRKIVHIDEEKCNGCGACASACHEGAIAMINGKARLIKDDYCDGLGDCLPACPTGAITLEEREAKPYDEEAVMAEKCECACPGSSSKTIRREPACSCSGNVGSYLGNWPVQIKLAPIQSPCFSGSDLLIAADCTAFSYGSFHQDFMKNHVTLIGCPKLDSVNYCEKLASIIKANEIKSVTVTRMEVPCCGGLEMMTKHALEESGKDIPLRIVVISTEGLIIDER